MRRRRWWACLGALTMVAGALALAGSPPAQASGFAPECQEPSDAPVLTVGVLDCLRIESDNVGAITAFTYFIPPACGTGERRCPVLYYLHGTGGSYQSLGAAGTGGGSFVRALSSGPPVDPRTVAQPWLYGSTSTWIPLPTLDLIIVAPHGRTVPGGHGPVVGADTGWADWHPKYAAGGEFERYPTPPPRWESFLVDDLVPFVDTHFPTVGHRQWRAITGHSQGGFGSFANGFAHPDVWSAQGMISGGGFPFPALLAEEVPPLATHLAPPVALPYVPLPGAVPMVVPTAAMTIETLVAEVTVGFGDPVMDNVWWRQINPTDLAGNMRARAADGTQSTYLDYHVNDAIPRRLEDFEDPESYARSQAFEAILFPIDLFLEQIFDMHGVERRFDIGPGLHGGVYQAPYYRQDLEAFVANLASDTGAGTPRPDPARFDYRTSKRAFSVWGWEFAVERGPDEFLFLTDVTCDAITLRGSGTVTFRVPDACGTGVGGSPVVTVVLGPSWPVNEPVGAGSIAAYGERVTVALQPNV